MKKKIVLDVDGVILDFGSAYLKLAREVLGNHIEPNMNEYDLKDFLQVHEEDNQNVWNIFNERNIWENIPPLKGAVEAIQIMNQLPIDIYIVSSIDKSNTNARLKNLANIGLVPKEIYCVGDGNAHKHDFISQIQPIAFVDDRLDHLYRSLEIPHLVWVDNNQKQKIELFPELNIKVNSLQQWVLEHINDVVK